jgi:CRP/FNR family cyclic AMP-dependent transcriptional regulator
VSSTADRLAGNDVFEGLSDAALVELDGRLPIVSFRKGELISSPHDTGQALFLIEAGRVRLYRSAGDGRQLTVSILDAGMAFGHVALLEERVRDSYAEAMVDTVLRVLRRRELEQAVDAHPALALNLLRALAGRLCEAESQLECLAFRGVSSRLAAKLLELMNRYGRVTREGIRIDERFTHLQLAEMIGTSRETLTKVLNEQREEGLIDVRERMLWVLDPEGLERLTLA